MSNIFQIIHDLRAESASLRKEAKNTIYVDAVKDRMKHKAEKIDDLIFDLGMLYRDELYPNEDYADFRD